MGLACKEFEVGQRWSRAGDVFVQEQGAAHSVDFGEAYHNRDGAVELNFAGKLNSPSRITIKFDGFTYGQEKVQLPQSRELKAVLPTETEETIKETIGVITISERSACAEIQSLPENFLCLAF